MKLQDIKPLYESLEVPNINNLKPFLDTHCSQWFKELQNPYAHYYVSPCFRGLSKDVGDFAILTTHENRRPRDSYKEIHELFDNWFQKHFGIKMRSHKVMFATGSPDAALEYTTEKGMGTHGMNNNRVYNVFPIGSFKYVWSPLTKDLFSTYENMLPEAVDNTIGWEAFEKDPDAGNAQIMKYMEAQIDDMMYTDTDLSRALQVENEVMIHCDRYLVVRQHIYEKFVDMMRELE